MDVLTGDCLALMSTMEADSVDAIVTDPPYGLAFMGKAWDHSAPAIPFWEAALRVAKPGSHLVAFGGTRTYHRLTCAIEDAGWEIRDCLSWLYGSGFPKSHDVSKALDKAAGRVGTFGAPKSEAHAGWIERGRMRGGGGHEGLQRPWMDDAEAVQRNARQYEPATDSARQWSGWGTALKPAWEPIILARKPLIGAVAANVMQHGAGGLNIEACRVSGEALATGGVSASKSTLRTCGTWSGGTSRPDGGRWPANVVLDHEAAAMLDEQSEGKSRFFYCAKASRSEREKGLGGAVNRHPTVKPVALMRWLCRLVTPPGGLVLDPFTGSGTTGIAAALEGFRFLGIEREPEYVAIAKARIAGSTSK